MKRTESRFNRWWWGPYGAAAIVQLGGMWMVWELYRFGRYLVRDQRAEALVNGRAVIEFEEALGVHIERAAQDLLLSADWLVEAVGQYYVHAHFAPVVACLAWLYVHHRRQYLRYRNALVAGLVVGLAIHSAFPLAPPRMMRELGLVDVLHVYGPRVYELDRAAGMTNQFAAMPSFHFGWALLVACAVISLGRGRLRYLVVLHPLAMAFAVVATANHYILDAAVGGLVILGALAVVPAAYPARQPMPAETQLVR